MMKKQRFLLLCVIAATISIALTMFIFSYYTVYDTEIIAFDFEVPSSPMASFNLDNDTIHFGSIPRGSSSLRSITIENDRDSFVILKPSGTDYFNISKNYFLMPANQPTKIELNIEIPFDAEVGKYNGNLLIILKRPKS